MTDQPLFEPPAPLQPLPPQPVLITIRVEKAWSDDIAAWVRDTDYPWDGDIDKLLDAFLEDVPMDVAIEIDDMEVGRLPNDFAEKLTASLLPRYPKPWIDWQEDG